jgi:DNA invertase Pin-like site-specific DNA recombinase
MNAAKRIRRAALYVRVSTDRQTVENQEIQLRQVAERRGWEVIEVYSDAGISGAKDRKQRPGLDRSDASRGKFNVVMAWAIDRVGRSLIDLLGTIQHLEACGVDLYLDQQNIDTTTPMGKLIFQITGAFVEFEHDQAANPPAWRGSIRRSRMPSDGPWKRVEASGRPRG